MYKFVKRELDRTPAGKQEENSEKEVKISKEPEASENEENDTPQPEN